MSIVERGYFLNIEFVNAFAPVLNIGHIIGNPYLINSIVSWGNSVLLEAGQPNHMTIYRLVDGNRLVGEMTVDLEVPGECVFLGNYLKELYQMNSSSKRGTLVEDYLIWGAGLKS